MKDKRIFGIIAVIMVFIFLYGCAGNRVPTQLKQRAGALKKLGEAYMAEGKYTHALRELIKSNQLNSDDPQVHNDLGLTYLAKERLEKAIKHLQRAVDLDPNYSAARNNLGTAYVATEQWDKAIECFKTVSEDLLYMTPHFSLSNLGYVYYRKGEYQKAEQYYLKALEMKHDFPKALRGIGRVYLATGNVHQAIDKLKRAIEKAPKAAPFYMDLGRAYTKNHQYNKALQIYGKAAMITEDPDFADKAEAEAEKVMEIY